MSFTYLCVTLRNETKTSLVSLFQSISTDSGHYRPTNENLGIFLAFLRDKGVNLEEVQV